MTLSLVTAILATFLSGDVVIHTTDGPGLAPEQHSTRIVQLPSDLSSQRVVTFAPQFDPSPKLSVPAFDSRCTLDAIRTNTDGSHDLVAMGPDGMIDARFPLALSGTPSRLYIGRGGVAYLSLLPKDGAELEHDFLMFDPAGSEIAALDLPGTTGVRDFDLDIDGCELLYADGTGSLARFNVCTRSVSSKPVPALPADVVRFLPAGEILLLSQGSAYLFDAAGSFRLFYSGSPLTPAESVAIVPDGRSVLLGSSGYLLRLPYSQHGDIDGGLATFVSGALHIPTITVCGDWRNSAPRRRAARH
jgi:hypothetical protein